MSTDQTKKKNNKGCKAQNNRKKTFYYCDEHGRNESHTTDKCFKLHPELISSRKKTTEKTTEKPKDSVDKTATELLTASLNFSALQYNQLPASVKN